MAWDFETEPEFEAKLEWMRRFVRDEIIPLETLADRWRTGEGRAVFRQITDPLKDEVRRQGLWAAHLPPDMGGQGFGQVKLGLMHEILGQCGYAPSVFGNNAPDSGNAELIAVGGTDAQARAVDAAVARWQGSQCILDDGTRCRRRPDTAEDHGSPRRRRVGHQRPQMVLVQRLDQRLPGRDGEDRRLREAVQELFDDHRADQHAGCRHPPRRAHDG